MKMKLFICPMTTVVLTVLLACNCQPSGGTSETAESSAGVVNPDKPVQGEWDLKAKKVWEVSDIDGNPLAAPMITVSEDEITYVFDQTLSLNFSLDKDGKRIALFGKKGQGPGEVVNELFFFPVEDKLVIFGYPNRLHFFNRNGEFFKTENINISDMPYFFINENEYISAPPPAIGDSEIKYINLQTGEKRVIQKITYDVPVIHHERNVIVAIPGLIGLMKLGFDQEKRRIYFGINDRYRIDIADLEGNRISSFSVKRKRRIVSNDIKQEAVLSNLKGLPAEVQNKSLKLLPDEITCFHKIQIEDGLIYVFQDNVSANWEYQQIDIFSLDGEYLYRAVFKPEGGKTIYNSQNYSDIMFIKKDGLYLSLEDRQGEITVAKYKISIPDNPSM